MSSVIKIENLSKQYRLGVVGTGTLSHDLRRWWHTVRGKEDPYLKIGNVNDRTTVGTSEYVWALKDINFEVEQGEVLGIIGKNGAGKSTLLKILSKVTAPTMGSITYKGRIGSLLEVGTGFNPELTGRENIFLNGAILGMRKKEIDSKFDEIVDFSGCERYIDTPVKRYSSGMSVRLGFAVAAFLEPEILIVDEVLAIGDAEFQKKAIGKIQDVSSKEGRTVLFVSHNLTAVQRLCTKAILLENGQIVSEGPTENLISKYLSENYSLVCEFFFNESTEQNKSVKVVSAYCADFLDNKKKIFLSTDDIYLKFIYVTKKENLKFTHGLNVYNEQEVNVFNSHDTLSGAKLITRKENQFFQAECIIPKNLLNEGIYTISFALFSPEPFILYNHMKGILTFKIIDIIDGTSSRGEYTGSFPGIIRPLLNWSYKIV